MKERIKKYVDKLFADIYDTRQLQELKEEISANLLEKINDSVAAGKSPEAAFQHAVASLGDMSELVESLKKASEDKIREELTEPPLDRKHVLGYVTASVILLLAITRAGMFYLKTQQLGPAFTALMPLLTGSVALFIYYGLTQESSYEYGMKPKRALQYVAGAVLLLVGIAEGGKVYFGGLELYKVIAAVTPFIVPAVALFVYLGLTEKCRIKKRVGLDAGWNQWVQYYSNPEIMMVRGSMSGALWIFTIAAFFLIGLTIGWKYSWLVFLVAVGVEVLFEAFFARKKKA